MLSILSPAKTLDYETAPTTKKSTQPCLLRRRHHLSRPHASSILRVFRLDGRLRENCGAQSRALYELAARLFLFKRQTISVGV